MNDAKLTDESLARALRDGDIGALDTLFGRYYPAIRRYCLRMTGDADHSEDISQEVFMRLLNGIGRYQYPRPFRPYLYAIAANLLRRGYRQAGNRREVSADMAERLPTDPDQAPERAAEGGESAQRVFAALQALSAPQRTVIVLRYYEELPLDEIAAALNLPLGTVKSRLRLGLERLRHALSDLEDRP